MKKGFAFIEFLIVMAILGILLASVAIPMCHQYNENYEKQKACQVDNKGKNKRSKDETTHVKCDSKDDTDRIWVHPETGYKCNLNYPDCNMVRDTYLIRINKKGE